MRVVLSFLLAPGFFATVQAEAGGILTNASRAVERGAISLAGRRLAAANEITDAQRTDILNKHNLLRAQVSSPCTAADMQTLVWDDSLEAAAAAWGGQCIWGHDPANGNDWGENLGMQRLSTSYTTATLTGFVQSWYDEIIDVEWLEGSVRSKTYSSPRDQCKSYDSGTGACMIGHFTQVVWASSTKVGCSVHKCNSGLNGGGGAVFVCKYNPPGNWATAGDLLLPYTFGAACAYCSSSCSNKLCPAETDLRRCNDPVNPVAGECTPPEQLGMDHCGADSSTDNSMVFVGGGGKPVPGCLTSFMLVPSALAMLLLAP